MKSYYLRQRLILGADSATTLSLKTVAIIGCGGLGSAVAHLLARMGVGTLILVDGDTVEEHNLARQHLYGIADIGKPKVEAAKTQLERINPSLTYTTSSSYIQTAQDIEQLGPVDLIIDGLDTHAIRRIIDAYCATKNMWWVHGAAIQEKGTVIALNGKDRSYASIYKPEAKDTHCADTGVLMTTTTMVATIQTRLAIKLLLDEQIPFELCHVNMDSLDVTTYPVKMN